MISHFYIHSIHTGTSWPKLVCFINLLWGRHYAKWMKRAPDHRCSPSTENIKSGKVLRHALGYANNSACTKTCPTCPGWEPSKTPWLLRSCSLAQHSDQREALAHSWRQLSEVFDLVFIVKTEYNPVSSMYHPGKSNCPCGGSPKEPVWELRASALSTIITIFQVVITQLRLSSIPGRVESCCSSSLHF